MRGQRFAPSWRDFDFLAFPPKLIPCMYVVDILSDPLDFRYRFIGTKVVEMEGREYTGFSVDDLPFQGSEKAVRASFENFMKNPVPTFFASSEFITKDTATTLYCGLRLPLSEDGKSVDKIVCLAHFVENTHDLCQYIQTLIDPK